MIGTASRSSLLSRIWVMAEYEKSKETEEPCELQEKEPHDKRRVKNTKQLAWLGFGDFRRF